MDFVQQHPTLLEACDLISNLISTDRYLFLCDIRLANVMFRGSTLVITDPIETDVD